jgi:thiol-disulfide isomerase/thioredoxin
MFSGCNGLTIDLGQEAVAETPQVEPEPEPEPEVTREVLFFTQPGCPPCEEAKPQLEELRHKGVKITEINIRERPDLARQYNIRGTPTYVVLEDGVEIERTQSITVLITILVKLLAFLLPLMLG